MQYDTFKELVLARLAEDIPNPKKITVQKIYRNNGEFLDGLVILENGINIGPALYLNYYYRTLSKGSSFACVYSQIVSQYEKNRAAKGINVNFFTDFEKVSSRIIMKLVNKKMNEELLRDAPHVDYMDLAIIFCCLFPVDPDIGNATVTVRHSHTILWGQDPGTLYDLARANTMRLLPPRLENMNSMLKSLAPLPDYPTIMVPEDPLYPMYILTNEQNFLGAASLTFTDLIASYAEKFESDFCILPSSIHEVILVPVTENDRMEDFSSMVREVNESQVAREDILSDHAYYYSRKEGAITY